METKNSRLRLAVAASSAPYLNRNSPTHYELKSNSCPIVVGRLPESGILLNSRAISREHAVIEYDGHDWTIRDRNSKAGTRLNQLPISATEGTIFRAGDQIQFGPIVMQVQATREDPARSEELDSVGDAPRSTIVARELGGYVTQIPASDLSGLAQQRLDVLLRSAAHLATANNVTELAGLLAKSAAEGTSCRRAIVIGTVEESEWKVLGQYPPQSDSGKPVEISRSLVSLARRGTVARLNAGLDDRSEEQMSIIQLNIQSAIGAPVKVDETVEAVLYLDARGGERPLKSDAAAFCVALAQLGGMSLANLKRVELARHERELRSELVAARLAQQRMIPDSHGEIGPVRYALEAIPGTIVAGDLFDIVRTNADGALVVLGDVMGKGAAAGLMMATVQTYFRARCNSGLSLSQLTSEANSYFFDRFKGQGFVTLWIGEFDRGSGRVTYVDAGHGHWRFIDGGGGLRSVESEGGPPLGAFATSSYDSGHLPLRPGDRVLLFSDGLIEQPDHQGVLFGDADSLNCLGNSRTPSDDVAMLLAAHRTFRGKVPIADDLTVASIELLGE
jgi:serine phosphatase RsbU (regulator of sigma subunit)